METAATTARVLLVDDNLSALRALEYVLDREGFHVDCAASGAVAMEMLRRSAYDVVVSDLKMPGMGGLELLAYVRETYPQLPVIILTAHGTVDNAVHALRQGAWDYLQKPFQPAEVRDLVRRATERRAAESATAAAPGKAAEARGLEALVGGSAAMLRVAEQLRTLGGKDISVVLNGESGTGKELAARALHELSPRRERPFVAVNCASIPETLLENELFGHVKGAYTGASANQRGLFEEAHTGTIFLDEIGDVPLSIQAKLLRVLQESEFKKIGGTRDVRVDVRVITATNKDLRAEVAAGRFREDLYYRINVVPVRMPALRERVEDIPVLAHHFRSAFNQELRLSIRGFSDEALAEMVNYPWPGNVRELKNRVKMAMVMAAGPVLGPDDLGLGTRSGKPAFPPFREAKECFERDYVQRALQFCGGNVKKAAQLAGRDRSTFYDLLKKYDIAADNFRGAC